MKSQLVTVIGLLLELRGVLEEETKEGHIGPEALEITEEMIELHRKPMEYIIASEKKKLSSIYYARNLLNTMERFEGKPISSDAKKIYDEWTKEKEI